MASNSCTLRRLEAAFRLQGVEPARELGFEIVVGHGRSSRRATRAHNGAIRLLLAGLSRRLNQMLNALDDLGAEVDQEP
jgi:hypothetical protein